MLYTRRDVGKLALASVPLSVAFGAKINSKFFGVQIGAISYSFNRIASPDATAIIKAMVEIGLGEVELMSNQCEALAGIPAAPAGGGFGGGAGGAGGPGGGAGPAARGAGGAELMSTHCESLAGMPAAPGGGGFGGGAGGAGGPGGGAGGGARGAGGA